MHPLSSLQRAHQTHTATRSENTERPWALLSALPNTDPSHVSVEPGDGVDTVGARTTVSLSERRESATFANLVAGITVQCQGADPLHCAELSVYATSQATRNPILPVVVSGVFELRAPTR